MTKTETENIEYVKGVMDALAAVESTNGHGRLSSLFDACSFMLEENDGKKGKHEAE